MAGEVATPVKSPAVTTTLETAFNIATEVLRSESWALCKSGRGIKSGSGWYISPLVKGWLIENSTAEMRSGLKRIVMHRRSAI